MADIPRLKWLDGYRGAVIAAMIFVNGQFSHQESFKAFTHAEWDGWTFADTIFPCFLYLVGVSLAISTRSRVIRGSTKSDLHLHALKRSLLIFGSGLIVDNLRIPSHEFPFVGLEPHLQLTGVLQKISICYFVAFEIYLLGRLRGAILGIFGLNALYLFLLFHFPIPGCGAGSLVVDCNFPGYFDEMVLDGFRWNSSAFDPDGLGAILPAIFSILSGVVAAHLLAEHRDGTHNSILLLLTGIALIVFGEGLSYWVPINKQLWTTSFAILMAGMACVGLAFFISMAERPAFWRILAPLELLGSNALLSYLISRVLVNVLRVHVHEFSLYDSVLARVGSGSAASLLFAMVVLLVVYFIVRLDNGFRILDKAARWISGQSAGAKRG